MKKIIHSNIDIQSINNQNEIIKQQSISFHEHFTDVVYQVLSKNEVTKQNQTMFCPGYFNRRTNFLVGEKSSLMVIDKDLNVLSLDTSEIIKRNSDYLIYPVPAFNIYQNYELQYSDNNSKDRIVHLTNEFGTEIGKLLFNIQTYSDVDFKEIEKYCSKSFFKSLVQINDLNHINLNKHIILNTNYDFIIGILMGYYEASSIPGFFIKSNINIYSFTLLLNYIGASYSIRTYNDTKKVFFQVSSRFVGLVQDKFIKLDSYVCKDNKIIKTNNVNKIMYEEVPKEEYNSLQYQINQGIVILIPISSINFEQQSDTKSTRLWDLMAEKPDATNYSLYMTPFLKNSDGDILAASGIFTKEALKDSQKFSPETKEYYRSLNTGNIQTWIADDAILGLYNSTNILKNQ